MSPQRPRARVLPVLCLAASVCIAAACTSTESTSPPPSTAATTAASTTSIAPPATKPPPTTAPTTTQPPDDETQIRQVIDTYWRELIAASNPPDPSYAPLLAVVAPPQSEREVGELQKKVALHEAARLPDNPQYSHVTMSVEIAGDSAVAQGCLIDDVVVFNTTDGSIANADVTTSRQETHLVKTQGTWKISNGVDLDTKKGVVPCGLSRQL